MSWALTSAASWAIGSGWAGGRGGRARGKGEEGRRSAQGWEQNTEGWKGRWEKRRLTYVLQNALHHPDRDLGRLDETVLPLLDVEPRLLALRPPTGPSSARRRRALERLPRRVELEPRFRDGLAGTEGVLERLGERPLEGVEEAVGDLRSERERAGGGGGGVSDASKKVLRERVKRGRGEEEVRARRDERRVRRRMSQVRELRKGGSRG